MSKEIKCPSCTKWNPGNQKTCSACGSVLDINEFEKIQREKSKPPIKERIKKKPTWLDRFMEKTQNSKNPFVIVTRTLLYYTWVVYMGIVLFFTWITIYTAG